MLVHADADGVYRIPVQRVETGSTKRARFTVPTPSASSGSSSSLAFLPEAANPSPSACPEAIGLLEAGNITAAEAVVCEAHLEAGLRFERDCREAARSFSAAAHAQASALAPNANAADGTTDSAVVKEESPSPPRGLPTFGLVDLTWNETPGSDSEGGRATPAADEELAMAEDVEGDVEDDLEALLDAESVRRDA